MNFSFQEAKQVIINIPKIIVRDLIRLPKDIVFIVIVDIILLLYIGR
jgi:hypothetical protein